MHAIYCFLLWFWHFAAGEIGIKLLSISSAIVMGPSHWLWTNANAKYFPDFDPHVWLKSWRTHVIVTTWLVTTRKRSLWRLCFPRCLSVHRVGCLPHCMLGYTPPPRTRDRHPQDQRQTPLLWPDTPWADSPPGRHPLGRYPQADTPLPEHAGIRSTRGWYASHWNAFL